MKKYIYTILFLFSCFVLPAQISVGIQIQTPEGLFHIDGLENNNSASAATKYKDDVIFTTDGKLGLGTNVPQNTLHIQSDLTEPVFRLEDGTQKDGYMLTSDEDGYASWKQYTAASSVFWSFGSRSAYQSMYFSSTLSRLENVTSTVTGILPGFVHDAANSTLLVPKGKYILVMHGDINGHEVAQLGLYGTSVSSGVSKYYVRFWYHSYLNASSIYLSLSEDIVLELHASLWDGRSQYWGGAGTVYPNGAYGAFYQISFIRLK